MTSPVTPTASSGAAFLPRPACGERVGVRGLIRRLRLAERPPHPARKSAPTSPRARGEVLPSGTTRSITAILIALTLGAAAEAPAQPASPQPAPSSPAAAPPPAAATPARQRVVIGYVDVEGDPR